MTVCLYLVHKVHTLANLCLMVSNCLNYFKSHFKHYCGRNIPWRSNLYVCNPLKLKYSLTISMLLCFYVAMTILFASMQSALVHFHGSCKKTDMEKVLRTADVELWYYDLLTFQIKTFFSENFRWHRQLLDSYFVSARKSVTHSCYFVWSTFLDEECVTISGT